jgi:hypothetical protein
MQSQHTHALQQSGDQAVWLGAIIYTSRSTMPLQSGAGERARSDLCG